METKFKMGQEVIIDNVDGSLHEDSTEDTINDVSKFINTKRKIIKVRLARMVIEGGHLYCLDIPDYNNYLFHWQNLREIGFDAESIISNAFGLGG